MILEPTYSTEEVVTLLSELDKEGLEILATVLYEEKKRYCLVDLELFATLLYLMRQ